MWNAGVRRPVDYAVDPILYVDRTLSVCELSDIGHIRIYIVYVGKEWASEARVTMACIYAPQFWSA